MSSLLPTSVVKRFELDESNTNREKGKPQVAAIKKKTFFTLWFSFNYVTLAVALIFFLLQQLQYGKNRKTWRAARRMLSWINITLQVVGKLSNAESGDQDSIPGKTRLLKERQHRCGYDHRDIIPTSSKSNSWKNKARK
ncbi:hypothetical protein ACFE04_021502 [Oxalis oulophora]